MKLRRERKDRIRDVLFMAACPALLWGFIKTGAGSPEAIVSQLAKSLLRQGQELAAPGFLYLAEGKAGTPGEWLARQVMELLPAAGYADSRKETGLLTEDPETLELILARQAADENAVDEDGKLIGQDDSAETRSASAQIDTSPDRLQDFDYLLSNFYTVDGSTMIRSDELNGKELMSKDLRIDLSGEGPKILIYHTHSQEMFADSVAGDPATSIVGVGDYLTTLLNDIYHIETLHHTGVYDLIDGELDRSRAYDLAKPEIAVLLEANPSIQVVIDLHRDGVADTTRLVTEIDGRQTAQIMFFNGLSRTRANGEIDYLANPYIQDNLAFSLQMQAAAYENYPGFARRIYLRGYRYNMHLMPRCLLVEAGAQTNTVQEMKNAMEVLAELLNMVLTE